MGTRQQKITDYVNSMFAALPRTKEAIDIKQNILESMEDKYAEYVEGGMPQDEAFAKVKEQFGSIDEVRAALGLSAEQNADADNRNANYDYDEDDEDDEDDEPKIRRSKLQKAIISVIMPCAVVIFFIFGLFGNWHPGWLVFPIFGVLCGAVAAVFDMINCKSANVLTAKRISHFIGKILMIFAVIAYLLIGFLMGGWHPWWILFPVIGMMTGIIDCIFTVFDKQNTIKRRVSAIGGMIMLTAIVCFLVLGVFGNLWHPAWIVFPIGGMLTSISVIIYEARKGEDNE